MRILLVLLSLAAAGAEVKPIVPTTGAKAAGPYTPGLLTGDFLYVAGRGSSGAGGPTIEGQTRACLDNVKGIVETAGLTMDDVVYAHLYLSDIQNYEAVNKVWPEYFKDAPARATVGVARIPVNDSIEVTVVARKGANKRLKIGGVKNPVPISQGVFAGDRFYVAGILGRDSNAGTIPSTVDGQVKMVFDRLSMVLKSAKLSKDHVAFVNVYRTSQVPEAAVQAALAKFWAKDAPTVVMTEVTALPFAANVSITGVAALDRGSKKSDGKCTGIGNTWYCASQTEMEFAASGDTLATTVLMDNLDEFATMNAAYAKALADRAVRPTRTTFQAMPTGQQPKFRFSYIVQR